MEENYIMISFENTHAAMQAEKLLGKKLSVATMPTLRSVTQSCGISLRLAAEDYEPARAEMAASGIDSALYAIYLVDINKKALELSQ